MKNNQYIPSVINYMGGKFTLLPQIIPLLPAHTSVFVDLFCGSCVVALNASHDFVICNDKCKPIIDLYDYLKNTPQDDTVRLVYERKHKFGLSNDSKEAYTSFRDDVYNIEHQPLDLLLLLFHSFDNQIRFNQQQHFTETFGARTFTTWHENRLRYFIQTIQNQQWMFTAQDFRNINTDSWDETYFVYIDPPYSNGHASYNKFLKWTDEDDADLFDFIDTIHVKNVSFALSNTLINKSVPNTPLIEWSRKYNIYKIDSNYSNSCYSRKDRNKENTLEVLITNYIPNQQSQQGQLF